MNEFQNTIKKKAGKSQKTNVNWKQNQISDPKTGSGPRYVKAVNHVPMYCKAECYWEVNVEQDSLVFRGAIALLTCRSNVLGICFYMIEFCFQIDMSSSSPLVLVIWTHNLSEKTYHAAAELTTPFHLSVAMADDTDLTKGTMCNSYFRKVLANTLHFSWHLANTPFSFSLPVCLSAVHYHTRKAQAH